MSGAPKVRSLNVSDSEARPVLVPGGNKARSMATVRKPASKPPSKTESTEIVAAEGKKKASSPSAALPHFRSSFSAPSVIRRHEILLQSNLSLNASCSSDASTDSFCSRTSTGKIGRTSLTSKRRQSTPRIGKTLDKAEKNVSDDLAVPPPEVVQGKRKCAWVTPNTGEYVCFPCILDSQFLLPICAMIRVACHLSYRVSYACCYVLVQITDEFGSFDKYCWSFVNYKPIVSKFRYPRQVPVKSPKADVISKDLVKRGFRSVGPTVVYSFMQSSGLTNDHLISCFRFQECVAAASSSADEANDAKRNINTKVEEKTDTGQEMTVGMDYELSRAMDELNIT
ncbi:hypothetical protein BHE74_00001671 [Ensete ventricosum]|nr:hypothetical protein BHE74_00001671 [Ensete ventricosum]